MAGAVVVTVAAEVVPGLEVPAVAMTEEVAAAMAAVGSASKVAATEVVGSVSNVLDLVVNLATVEASEVGMQVAMAAALLVGMPSVLACLGAHRPPTWKALLHVAEREWNDSELPPEWDQTEIERVARQRTAHTCTERACLRCA